MSSTINSTGFKLNHTGLRVANLDASVTFYTQVFGMKELYRISLDAATIAFVGYATSENDTTPVWAREGVLELVAPKNEAAASQRADSRFVKLAISVPDIAAAMEHVTNLNAKVVKKLGAADSEGVVASFSGAQREEGKDEEFWKAVEGVAFVEDPDGYLIEVIPYSA